MHSEMGTQVVPQEPPVGKKSVDSASEAGVAAGL